MRRTRRWDLETRPQCWRIHHQWTGGILTSKTANEFTTNSAFSGGLAAAPGLRKHGDSTANKTSPEYRLRLADSIGTV